MTDEKRLQLITEQLIIVRDNLFRGLSKSMQKLQAQSINEVLELPNYTQSAKQEQGEPVGMAQVYRCKIKSRKQIDREIPREKQGWWADISAGQLIRLREATQADVDRCTLNGAHSKDPADYMCETHTNGSLVSKVALEYMNPEQNVFASTTPQQRKPLTDEQIANIVIEMNGNEPPALFWKDLTRAIEAAHGIKE